MYLLLQDGSDNMLYTVSHTCAISNNVNSAILDTGIPEVCGSCVLACLQCNCLRA